MTMASVVTMFAALFNDMGMGAAVVQRKTVTPNLLNTVFWSNVAFGIGIGIVVSSISPLAARVFSEPRLTSVLLFLACLFPITALGTLHLSLLERNARFRSVALAEIAASLLGLATALILASEGAGVYSLVGQSIATALALTAGYWIMLRWQPALMWRRNSFRAVWRFGSNLAAFNILNYFIRNSDNILIGAVRGPNDLGIYNLAYRLMFLPTQTLTTAVNRVLFPVYSERLRTGVGIGDYFLKVVGLLCLLTAPVALGLWAVRQVFVEVLLGPQWLQSAAVLAWLAPAGLLQALLSTTGSVLSALGRTRLLMFLGLKSAFVIVLALSLTVTSGIVAMSEAYFFTFIGLFFVDFYFTLKELKVSSKSLFASMWRPVLCAIIMSAIVSFAGDQLAAIGIPAAALLVGLVVLGFCLYVSLVAIISKNSMGDLKTILATKRQPRGSANLPSPLSDG